MFASRAFAAAMDFTDVTSTAGITHTHSHAIGASFWDPEQGWMTGGAVAEDFNNDGWMDLYVLQGGLSANLLYINQQNGTFVDQAAPGGAGLTGNHVGVCAADYDSDGDVDIFISAADTTVSPHVLLLNDGTGNFTVDAVNTFAQPVLGASSPSWGDFNNDGRRSRARRLETRRRCGEHQELPQHRRWQSLALSVAAQGMRLHPVRGPGQRRAGRT